MSITVTAILTAALAELRVVGAADVPAAEDQDLALTIFNELLEAWNADHRAVYADVFTSFTLTPNLQPHTIGLAANTPTWTVTTNRPETIDGANLVLTNVTPNVRVPLTLRAAAWWLGQSVQGLTAAIPTDLYYKPSWPNGSVYLWPVPTTAYQVELQTRALLASVALTETLTLPPGYQQALRLTLAELLAPSFGVPVSPTTTTEARKARARIFDAHDDIPRLDSDAPSSAGAGGFDYYTGTTG